MALVALIAGATACGDGKVQRSSSQGERSALCRAADRYNAADRHEDENSTNDQVRKAFDAYHRGGQAVVDAATGDLRTLARAVLTSKDRYRARFLKERMAAGDGHSLLARAKAAGFFTTGSYIESLASQDASALDAEQVQSRRLSEELGAECDGLTVLSPGRLDARTAPSGEILAAKSGTNEIHRFRPDGTEIGRLELPGVVGPITYLTLSPDGTRLAFLAGTTDRHLWVMDLPDGRLVSTTPPTCMDWADDGKTMWASVGKPPAETYIAHISLDGTEKISDEIHRDGCPYRFTGSDLVVYDAEVDGQPPRIERVPMDGSEPTTLVSGPCSNVAPRISPDHKHLMVTTGCQRAVDSGTIITDLDGRHPRQIAHGDIGSGSWSPDGRWVTFMAMSPGHAGDGTKGRVIVASVDRPAMGVVTPPGFSWPTWVPAGVLPS